MWRARNLPCASCCLLFYKIDLFLYGEAFLEERYHWYFWLCIQIVYAVVFVRIYVDCISVWLLLFMCIYTCWYHVSFSYKFLTNDPRKNPSPMALYTIGIRKHHTWLDCEETLSYGLYRIICVWNTLFWQIQSPYQWRLQWAVYASQNGPAHLVNWVVGLFKLKAPQILVN